MIDGAGKFGHRGSWEYFKQMASVTHEFKLNTAGWPEIEAVVATFCVTENIPPMVRHKLSVCLDELFTNSKKYAAAGTVWLSLEISDGTVAVAYADSGAAFDPVAWCAANTPDPELPPDQVGGAGLHIVMGLCQQVAYRRAAERNELDFHLAF